jgi:thymidylate synthase
MKIYRGKHIAHIYKDILNDLWNSPEYTSNPRGMEVKEIINCIIEIEEPNFNMFKNETRSSPERYVGSELLWYFSGTNKADFIENYASMWTQLKNDRNEVNSAYGYLIFKEENDDRYTQYEWVIESLKKDKDSRQAFMHFNKPYHQYNGNKDQVCTLTALFHIRNNKLLMTLNMRSNDVILGFMTDFTFFNMLHQQVFLHLKKYYPELEMGSYTHTSHSMHLYAKHYELVEKMLKTDFLPHSTPLLNTSIIDEDGMFRVKYFKVFHPVIKNNPIKVESTDNNVINWCLEQLKKEK